MKTGASKAYCAQTERLRLKTVLAADHLTLEGGGGWFWKKFSCKHLLEEKNCMQHKWNRKKILALLQARKKMLQIAISSGLYKIPVKLQPFSGWLLMRLHFCISICFKFFTPGWYVITKGTIWPLVCLVCFLGADCSPAKETSVNVLSIRFYG